MSRGGGADHERLFLDQTSGCRINNGAKVYSRSLSDSKFVRMCSERSQGEVRGQMRGMAEADAEVVQRLKVRVSIVDYLLPSII